MPPLLEKPSELALVLVLEFPDIELIRLDIFLYLLMVCMVTTTATASRIAVVAFLVLV